MNARILRAVLQLFKNYSDNLANFGKHVNFPKADNPESISFGCHISRNVNFLAYWPTPIHFDCKLGRPAGEGRGVSANRPMSNKCVAELPFAEAGPQVSFSECRVVSEFFRLPVNSTPSPFAHLFRSVRSRLKEMTA